MTFAQVQLYIRSSTHLEYTTTTTTTIVDIIRKKIIVQFHIPGCIFSRPTVNERYEQTWIKFEDQMKLYHVRFDALIGQYIPMHQQHCVYRNKIHSALDCKKHASLKKMITNKLITYIYHSVHLHNPFQYNHISSHRVQSKYKRPSEHM